MEQVIKVNDMKLQGRFIVDANLVWCFFPTPLIMEAKSLRVKINEGKPIWVLTLKNGEKWYYEPFSHEIRKVANIRFGRIFFGRFARYLRDKYEHKACEKELYSVYFCTRKTMFLVKEIKECWPEDCSEPKIKTKWLESFPSSPEAEEYNKDEPY